MSDHGSRNRRNGTTSRFRLRDYDYTTPGMYFITICTENRVHRFGEVVDNQMKLSPAGKMVSARWSELPTVFTDVMIDISVTMPNHVHAIIGIGISTPDAPQVSLAEVVHWYKSTTTTSYIRGVHSKGWPRFEGRIWQTGYHDHIVRSARDLNRIREYVESNPALWRRDVFSDPMP